MASGLLLVVCLACAAYAAIYHVRLWRVWHAARGVETKGWQVLGEEFRALGPVGPMTRHACPGVVVHGRKGSAWCVVVADEATLVVVVVEVFSVRRFHLDRRYHTHCFRTDKTMWARTSLDLWPLPVAVSPTYAGSLLDELRRRRWCVQ